MAAEIGWYPDPYDASQLRWWDGTQWSEHVSPTVAPPAPATEPWSAPAAQPWGGPSAHAGWGNWSPAPLEQISGPAIAVQVLLVGWLVLGIVTLGSLAVERGLIVDLRADPLGVSLADLEASDDRLAALGGLRILLLVTTGMVFLLWMNRAYKNLQAFGATTLRRSSGWSVGGWFIPFANLVLPYQSMKDIWLGSDPDRTEYPVEWWGRGGRTTVVGWWWGLWLGSGVAAQVAGLSTPAVDADLDAYVTSNGLSIFAEVIALASAVTALVLVRQLTARQQQRAAARAGAV